MSDIAEHAPQLLAHLNGEHLDSMQFVVRVLAERPAAATVEATAIDGTGIDVVVDGEALRLDFAEEAADIDAVFAQSIALVARAREVSGEEGLTSAEVEAAELAAASVHLAEVVAVEDVLPHLRKITFRGERLGGFTSKGADTCFYTLVGSDAIEEGWGYERVAALPEGEQPSGAYYTVRARRPEVHEVDMLFVLHGDDGALSAWAGQAAPGQRVGLWGPRGSWAPPADADWWLLVCDETGLPAVANALEALPAGVTARVFAEVADDTWRAVLPDVEGVDVTWLVRPPGVEAGRTTLLVDAVRALAWPGGAPYVWGGGESRAVTAVRKYVRHEVGLDRERCDLTGYWRHAAHSDDPIPVED